MKPLIKIIFIAALALSLFTRAYLYLPRFQFSHDSDLSAWIMKDMVFDGHIRLIGQLTSAPGIFIGPLFYYSLVPLYTLTNYDPIGTVAFSWLVGLIAVTSLFFVVAKLHSLRAGLFCSLLYAASFGIVQTEREVVPTTLIFLWSIWFYYCAHAIAAGKKHALNLAAILIALTWHIQLNLIILSLILGVIFLFNRRKFTPSQLVKALLLGVICFSPYLLFEARHGFTQTASLLGSTKSAAPVTRTFVEKILHVIEYASRNINYLFWELPRGINFYLLPGLLVLITLVLLLLRRLKAFSFIVIASWLILLLGFFVFHPINLSEYYINAVNPLWLIIFGLFLARFPKALQWLAIIIVLAFVGHNLHRLFTFHVNAIGYEQKTALIKSIRADAQAHSFPCVSLSFITDRGYELGYRYLSWYHGLKLAPITANTPVYSIVFPHSRVNRLDTTFGALGLVLPDYSRYTQSQITASCAGPDFNQTDSMFGFTK